MHTNIFLSNVRNLIGFPYAKVDCIGVVAKALNIRCAGTNWLFRSVNNSSKYRYLTELHKTSESVPPAGAVLFKVRDKIPAGYSDKPDAYHCGVLDVDGYVIHSSPSTGVRKDYNSHYSQWSYYGLMKQVDYSKDTESEEVTDEKQFLNQLKTMIEKRLNEI